ncbi:HAMP domain-containing sensor histidine kinase [Azospirillum sp. SYSU D00513]|uniref:sensor histidine kinase n=1 Tax=Azospirillum sp. SYSU D00513 TaxID=2812561 RepID=UPI001A977804|nr:HAMP domain-containing sensor histidine kinase [Azospirillum sp. SYSU D00513]
MAQAAGFSDAQASSVRGLTRIYEWSLYGLFALLPAAVIGYLHFYQDPGLKFADHGFHEVAIGLSILLSSFVAYVTFRCYGSSGEPFLKWLALAFIGFAIVYAPHGILTRASHHNMFLFLLYGPASRLVMAAFLFRGLLEYGKPAHAEAERGRSWLSWIAGLLVVDVLVFAVAMSPIASHPAVRLSMEYGALGLGLAGIAMMLARRIRSPLMTFYILAVACFVQSSAAFVIAKPWNHLWWIAHAIFAGGFFLLSFGVVRAFHTTRSFSGVYSQEEMMEHLATAKTAAEESLEQLRTMQASLIEAEKMAALGGLVAGVAHEINTPVGIILTAASHLEAETGKVSARYADGELSGDELEGYFDSAQQAARLLLVNSQRAADLIQSFKRVAVDQTANDRRVFDLKDYLDEILLSLRPNLRRTPHAITVDCPAGLIVDSTPGALSHCVTNLIANSLIHAYEEGTTGNLRIAVTQPEPGTVELVYSDDGKGIPAEHQPRVFEPFFTTRRSAGGSGLGLHVVYNAVVTSLKGTIQLRSEEGRGAAFTLRFPRSLGPRTAAESAPALVQAAQ